MHTTAEYERHSECVLVRWEATARRDAASAARTVSDSTTTAVIMLVVGAVLHLAFNLPAPALVLTMFPAALFAAFGIGAHFRYRDDNARATAIHQARLNHVASGRTPYLYDSHLNSNARPVAVHDVRTSFED